jgi:hypothetical protein
MFEVLEVEDVESKLSDLQTCDEPITREDVVKICEPAIDATDLLNVSICVHVLSVCVIFSPSRHVKAPLTVCHP